MDQNLKSNKILFSIVIPVYNVENYLIRCLKSIFEQHCDFVFEVIAVDDCSTDTTVEKIKAYKAFFYNRDHLTNINN
jgi:glycosyltransferase involved in cell wall biosynthesis